MNKPRIVKNIAVMCFGIFLFFSALYGIVTLQSSINTTKNMGVISLAVTNASYFLSSLFFSNYAIEKLGSKATYIISLIAMTPFIAANYYPQWFVMLPTSLLMGAAVPLLMVSQSSYMNDVADMYTEISLLSKKTKESFVFDNTEKRDYLTQTSSEYFKQDVWSISSSQSQPAGLQSETSDAVERPVEISRKTSYPLNSEVEPEISQLYDKTKNSYFSTIKPCFYQKRRQETYPDFDVDYKKRINESVKVKIFGIHGMAVFISNLLSNLISFLILRKGEDEKEFFRNSSRICGAYLCTLHSNLSNNTVEEVSHETRRVLITSCLSLGVIAILIIVFFLDPLKSKSTKSLSSFQLLMATSKFLKNKDAALLTPSLLTIGLTLELYTAEFTQAYINCSLGVHYVALVTLSYAFFCALSAATSGWLNDIFGRRFMITVAILLSIASCVSLLLWIPDPNHPEVFFLFLLE